MGVNYSAVLFDDEVLEKQIAIFRFRLSNGEVDGESSAPRFHYELELDPNSNLRPYEHGDFDKYESDGWSIDTNCIRIRLLTSAQETNTDTRFAANALYRFFSVFDVIGANYPFNEYNLTGSAIIGAKNAQLWHSFFKRIDFECLRSLFEQQQKSLNLRRVKTFEDLVGYANIFDELLVQAIEKNKTLYIFAE
jgi:hypothetical protein